MLHNRFTSLTLTTCLIVLAAFVVGCSMDSSNPMNTDTTTPSISAKRVKPENGGGNGDYDGSAYGAYGFEPVLLRKAFKQASRRTATAHITVANGGHVTLSRGSTKIRIKFPANSVPYDTDITLTLLDLEIVDLEVMPCMALNEPAELWVKGELVVPAGAVDLYHFQENVSDWSSEGPATVETFDEGGTQMFRIRSNTKLKLNHFSRYAFGSRF